MISIKKITSILLILAMVLLSVSMFSVQASATAPQIHEFYDLNGNLFTKYLTFNITSSSSYASNKIYVSNYGSNDVSVINGATNKVVSTISVGSGPNGVAYDPNNNEIYVANYGSNSVSVINGATNSVIATISNSLNTPTGAACDPINNEIYVANRNSGSTSGWVTVINGATNSVIGTIGAGDWPQGVTYDPANNYLYVANQGTYSNSVTVINGATNGVVTTISVGKYPYDSVVGLFGLAIQIPYTQYGINSNFSNVRIAYPNGLEVPFSISCENSTTADIVLQNLTIQSGNSQEFVLWIGASSLKPDADIIAPSYGPYIVSTTFLSVQTSTSQYPTTYLQLLFKNTQTIATAQNLPVKFNINYTWTIASGVEIEPYLWNVRFYLSNGQPLYAWVQYGTMQGYWQDIVWLNLSASIPANTEVPIIMQINPPTSIPAASQNIYTGLDANLTSWNPAGYDNGIHVFTVEDAFDESSLSSQWVYIGGITYSVGNGLSAPSASNTADFATSQEFNISKYTFDIFYSTSSSSSTVAIGIASAVSYQYNYGVTNGVIGVTNTTYVSIYSASSGTDTLLNHASISSSAGKLAIQYVYSANPIVKVNYSANMNSAVSTVSASESIQFDGVFTIALQNAVIHEAIVRENGPNNVAPSFVSYSLESSSYTLPQWSSSSSTTTSSPTYYTVSGTVTNTNNQIISGAMISFGSAYSTSTSSSGTYSISVIGGTYKVTVTANGYQTYNTTLVVSTNMTENFVLSPVTTSGGTTSNSGITYQVVLQYVTNNYVIFVPLILLIAFILAILILVVDIKKTKPKNKKGARK